MFLFFCSSQHHQVGTVTAIENVAKAHARKKDKRQGDGLAKRKSMTLADCAGAALFSSIARHGDAFALCRHNQESLEYGMVASMHAIESRRDEYSGTV